MSSWFKTFSKTPSQGTESGQDDAAVQALPASWYRSTAMFELERRAIFSKKWILVSHQQRIPNVGDYVRFTEAGFPFFLVRDKNDLVQAHHNVCRHRAYPIVEQDSGKASILACKYHGKLASRSVTPSVYSLHDRMVLRFGRQTSEGTQVSRHSRIRQVEEFPFPDPCPR